MSSQKLLTLILDGGISFIHQLNEKISNAYKGISLLKQVSHILHRKPSLAKYKAFIRPHLDYAKVIYDQPTMNPFVIGLNRFNIILHLQ